MSDVKLSEGSLRVIMSGGDYEEPIMQVLGSKKIAGAPEKERYRLLLSDGQSLISFAMLATQINDKVTSGELSMFTVIKLNRYITSMINNSGKGDKRVMVILDMEVVVPGEQVNTRIGNPTSIPDSGSVPPLSTAAATTTHTASSTSVQPKQPPRVNKMPQPQQVDLNQSVNEDLIVPLSSLSPYQNVWIIKARVTNKSQIRTWSNSRGEGKLFSFDLMDRSGEMRCTAFRDQVDKFYDFVEIDKVYYISKCLVKVANKQFSTLNSDYEITLTNETVIHHCLDEIRNIPGNVFSFITIDKIPEKEANTVVDVIGVCKSTGDLVQLQSRATGRELKKRDVVLVDQTNSAVTLTFWGSDAENFDGSSQPIIALRACRVSEFGGGKNLSIINSTLVKINPDLPEAHRLRGWFDNIGSNSETVNISARSGQGGVQTQWMSFREAKDQKLGASERGDYYQTKATVLLIRSETAMYKACPTEECNKKVIDMENGMYRCEKCNKEFTNYKYRLLMLMNLGDWSGNQWVSTFSTEGEKILGKTAQEVGEAMEVDKDSLASCCDQAHFREFVFKCRAKMESFQDENRLKTIVIRVDEINHKDYNAHLINQIKSMIAD